MQSTTKNTWVVITHLTSVMVPLAGLLLGMPEQAMGEEKRAAALALLQACLKTQAVTDHISVRVVALRDIPNHNKDWPRHHRAETFLRRDGERLDVATRMLYPDGTKEFQARAQRSRAVFTDGVGVFYWTLASRAQPSRQGVVDNNWAKWFTDHGLNEVTGGPLDGYFQSTGTQRAAEIMAADPGLRLRGQETLRGIPCQIVEARTPYGSYALWLAESKGFLPLKATCELGPDDIYDHVDGMRLSERPIAGRDEDQVAGSQSSVILDEVTVERLGDAFVPVSGTLTRSERFGARKVFVVSSYQRTDMKINPRFEGTDAFVTDLPKGARLNNLADKTSGVAYEWRGGKPAAAGATSRASVPVASWGEASPYTQYVWAIIGLVLLGAGLIMCLRAQHFLQTARDNRQGAVPT
jgi:hypothetical protein